MMVKEIVYLLSTKQGLTQDDLANKIGYTQSRECRSSSFP